jgi:demethylmenaquinone methyltransferase / 2-methoxy-6-polyprenyl-1,4-benzoquinol methylase
MTPGQVPLRDAFATHDTKNHYVRRLFSTIADRYDFITVVLSYGMDRRWKRRVAEIAAPKTGARALDLACGTGDIARELTARGASVVGLDVTYRMLQLARQKTTSVAYVCADMSGLPFGDAGFDAVSTGYGLRNVADLPQALREIHRVLRPGGVVVSLDFNRPENPFVRGVYLGYLTLVGSLLGWLLHRDPDTYRYIPASIRRYPGGAGVTALLRAEGFVDARWTAVLGGLMAIHVARKMN